MKIIAVYNEEQEQIEDLKGHIISGGITPEIFRDQLLCDSLQEYVKENLTLAKQRIEELNQKISMLKEEHKREMKKDISDPAGLLVDRLIRLKQAKVI